jgi:hypothetical protein
MVPAIPRDLQETSGFGLRGVRERGDWNDLGFRAQGLLSCGSLADTADGGDH